MGILDAQQAMFMAHVSFIVEQKRLAQQGRIQFRARRCSAQAFEMLSCLGEAVKGEPLGMLIVTHVRRAEA